MGLRQTPPGGGGRRSHVHFAYVTTPRGAKWYAHMAGPIHWFTCHEMKRTKPCLHVISDGELTCQWCGAEVATRVMGYVPLYRELDGKPVMVLVYEDAREELDRRRLHERVLVGRGPDCNDTVYILRSTSQEPSYQSRLPERLRPADLTRTLLVIWRLPELSQWYRVTEGIEVPEPKSKPSEKARDMANRILDGDRGTLGDVIDLALGEKAKQVQRNQEFAEQARKANRNGKHKPSE